MSIRVQLKSEKGVMRVIDADTGEAIKGIQTVEITHQAGSLPIIDLHIVSEDIGQYSAEGDAKLLAMSTGSGEMKAVKRIEFEDGEIIEYGEPA